MKHFPLSLQIWSIRFAHMMRKWKMRVQCIRNFRPAPLRTSEIPFFIFCKSRKSLSFFEAFCSCFGMAVVLFELKIFLCCIKRQKQRCFRSLTKLWAFFTNSQPFELERKFRIKRKWSTKPSGFTSCGDSQNEVFFFTSSLVWILPWSGPQPRKAYVNGKTKVAGLTVF